MKLHVGYIGLGLMGRPAALNLIKAGHQLNVYARRAAMMAPLTAAGATACNSPAEVAAVSDIIFINVSASSDVEAVVLGDNGIITTAKPGSVVVDMSTISPAVTRNLATQLAARQIEMLDAPVSGGPQGATAGTLAIMVGGKAEVFARLLPLLQALGRNIVHVGDHGAGQITKACNQIIVAQTITAIGEALLLAKAAGVDPAKVRQALSGGFADSAVLQIHGQRMLDYVFEPGFKTKLHHKDMQIVQESAAALGITLPGAAQTTRYLDTLMAQGDGELDSSAMLKALEQVAGVGLKSTDHPTNIQEPS